MPENIFKNCTLNISIQQIIGFIHLCGMLTENIYGFVIPKTFGHDPVYMTLFLSIPVSWLVCKNECLIFYLVKKYENPQYIMGSNPENANDISDLFHNLNIYLVFYYINFGLKMTSILIVNHRSTKIQDIIFIPTIILYSIYMHDINCKTEYTNHIGFRVLLLGLLLGSLYRTLFHMNNI